MSSRLDTKVLQLSKLSDEIKRLNTRLKELRDLKKKQETSLMNTMESYKIDKVTGYTLNSLKKKYSNTDKRRRTVQEKRTDATNLCWNMGITDPQNFMNDYKKTQRIYDI